MFKFAIECRDGGQISRILEHDLGDHVIGAPIHREQPKGGKVAWIGRNEQACMPSRSITAGDCDGPAPPNERQREGARIDAALDGHLANGVGLIPVGDLDDAARPAARRSCRREAALPIAARPAAGTLGVERDAPSDQRGRQAAEHDIGVGDGRLIPPFG